MALIACYQILGTVGMLVALGADRSLISVLTVPLPELGESTPKDGYPLSAA